MRIFGGDRIHGLMDRLGLEEDTPIEHGLISRSVEGAQKKVEEQNFEIRKRVLEYDDVMNMQRSVIYGERDRILNGEDLRGDVVSIVERILRDQVAVFTGTSRFAEDWDLEELVIVLRTFFPTTLTPQTLGADKEIDVESFTDMIVEDALKVYEAKEERFGADAMRALERWVLLRTIDAKWRDHLYEMDYLREGIGLRALAQIDPLIAYKNEGYKMFQEMMESIQQDFVKYLYHLEIQRQEPAEEEAAPTRRKLAYSGGGDTTLTQNFAATGAAAARSGRVTDTSAENYEAAQQAARTVVAPRSVGTQVGRNDPCPCGSGKKYKKCCGARS
jgi:preprotein translocase subunit SecA